jgi:gluconolactonase
LLWIALPLILSLAGACQKREPAFAPATCLPPVRHAGKVVELDPALGRIVPPGSDIQKLATGFVFIEGPVWVEGNQPYLLFTEVRRNAIYRWLPDGKITVFRSPAFPGRTGPTGLAVDPLGRLVVCEHGNRQITRLEKDGRSVVLVDRYQGKRLNSPNDAVYKSDGSLYFTDPPHGLRKGDLDPAKELDFNGVFRLSPEGSLRAISKAQSRPNGIAFSADETVLYVSNSDPDNPVVMVYEVLPDGGLRTPRRFFAFPESPMGGLPDGLTTDRRGNVYAAGPGGVWILSEAGRPLGRFQLAEDPSRVAWGEDGKTLYITAQTSLYRVALSTAGFRR